MGYTPPASIDIGSAAIDRASTSGAGYTFIDKNNPANLDGKITSVEIWVETDATGFEVAIFRVVAGNNFSTVDTHTIGNVTAGAKRTFEVDLDVQAGDYIGFYMATGTIEKALSGDGCWYFLADYIPCVNEEFTVTDNRAFSLYGTGDTGEGELTIGEAFAIADSLVKSGTKALAEAFSAVDSLVKNVTKQLAEAFSIVDVKVTKIVKTLGEAFAVKDSFKRFFYNLYTKISKGLSTYTKRNKDTSTYTKKDKERGEEF